MAGLKNLAKRTTMGVAPDSPQKKRKKKNRQPVDLGIQSLRLASLKRQLKKMSGGQPQAESASSDSPSTSTAECTPSLSCPTTPQPDSDMPPEDAGFMDSYEYEMDDDALPPSSACSPVRPSKKDEEEDRKRRWNETMRLMVDPLLEYWDRTVGKYPDDVARPSSNPCSTGLCVVDVATIHTIYFNYHQMKTFRHCHCRKLPQVLVAHGLFPTSPSQPRMAISLDLLEFYRTLCQQSSDAVTALANGLSSLYRSRGLRLLGATGDAMQDPIRRALGNSLQWYDTLVNEVDRYVVQKIEATKKTLPVLDIPAPHPSALATSTAYTLLTKSPTPVSPIPATSLPGPTASPPAPTTSARTPTTSDPPPASETLKEEPPPASTGSRSPQPPSQGSCDPYLQRLCPACFGGKEFGQSFQWGGDVHVALDGNFHHRHLKSGGDGVPFHQSTRFLSKEFIDGIGARVAAARARPPQQRTTKLPDNIVDADQESYKAASGDNKRQTNEAFDENGVMALVCRHDIPLFMVSINTPGEQQKDAVALLVAFFEMLPDSATVAALYDIACVLDRSIQLYDLLPEAVAARLQLATAVMHAYGHQWACQLHYNPRMRVGLGITDGEGTEHLWSRLRRMIGLERRASRAKRCWMLDRQCDSIAADLREGLGAWIRRRLHKNIQKKEAEAVRMLRRLDTNLTMLRRYWNEQRDAQGSVRALAPARLKKELTKVLQLQAQIDTLEEEIAEVRAVIKKMPFAPSDATFSLRNMEGLHKELKSEAEGLYTSLNIDHQFPELKDIPLEYLHNLLLARDLKLTIRKKAIRTFYEWDRVDGAIGGVNEALGTRLHQITRNSITRRAAAFENLIRKYNQHITYLEEHHQPRYKVPVPSRLPTQLASLRDMETSHLWEDVWISKTETPPKWLVDEDIWKGIKAFLNLDRCAEERARLEGEALNLLSWFGRELQALMVMTRDQHYAKYHTLLKARLQDHLLLISTWSNPFVPATLFKDHITYVERWLSQVSPTVTSTSSVPPTAYVPPPTSHVPSLSSSPQPLPQPLLAFVPPISPKRLPPLPSTPLVHTRYSPSQAEQADNVTDECEDDDDDEIVITGERLALTDVMVECELDDDEDTMPLEWQTSALRVDAVLWHGVKGHYFPPFDRTAQAARSFRNPAGIQYVFNSPQYGRLDGTTQWLDDECINGCGALLQQNFRVSEVDCAILSTYVVHEVLKNSNRTETAWRIASPTKYWVTPVWIIPIHDKDQHHWALAVIRVEGEEIQVFDSFGSCEFVSRWLPKIQTVIRRLVTMAKDHGYVPAFASLSVLSTWSARLLQVHSVQSNGYDCGVWVLWVIAAVIRGFEFAHIEEKNIIRFRKYLANLVRTIPV
ncbi:hypothetical protein PQX77_019312 [Marasmius sp. AFHP31]|nr:hypothetical protein PQX77_019312 [Marasmius sp. AFHP31]